MPNTAYCLQCGRAASLIGRSLDPFRPIVYCAFTAPNGDPAGHGRTLGTFDRDEHRAATLAIRVRRARQDHARGSSRTHDPAYCLPCREAATHRYHQRMKVRVPSCRLCSPVTLGLEDPADV